MKKNVIKGEKNIDPTAPQMNGTRKANLFTGL